MRCTLNKNNLIKRVVNIGTANPSYQGVNHNSLKYLYSNDKVSQYFCIFIHHPRYDGWRNGHLGPDAMTWRGLKDTLNGRGNVDVFIGILEFKELLMSKNLGPLIFVDSYPP